MTNPDPSPSQRIASVFNQAAPDYDHPALRFFSSCGARLAERVGLRAGLRVLDCATGTGAVAIPAAQAVERSGLAIGIDLAPEMLRIARAKAQAVGLPQLTLSLMDAASPAFAPASFDAIVCAFSVFLMPDEAKALSAWRRLLKPGGALGFSVFGRAAFQPLSELFVKRVSEFGVTFPAGRKAFATQKITTPQQCRDLLGAAGCAEIAVDAEQHGYFLADPADWWALVWGSGFRGAVSRIAPERIEAFKSALLADLSAIAGPDGLWVDVPALFAVGRNPQ